MKIGIIGTGGVGGYFGGKLAQAGNEVVFFARGEHLNEIQKNGLIVKSIKGDFNVNPANAVGSIRDIGIVDIAIIAVKEWQIKDIADDLNCIVKSNTIIIPLQNGILTVDELKGTVKCDGILGGLCRIMSKIDSPGVINHFSIEPTIVFGEVENAVSERCKKMFDIFSAAGIKSTISENIAADLWRKFIVICLGGLLAVTKTTYGELRSLKETRQMMIDLLEEVFKLSQKLNIDIESDFVKKSVDIIDKHYPYDSTASLTRDIWNGKPSEIESQNGMVVRLSEKFNLDSRVNKFVYQCILPMEIKARRAM